MNRSMVSVVSICILVLAKAACGAEWGTDFAKSSAAAEKAGKYMLLDFSGSDWCGWCMKLDKEVFSKPEFKEYAGKSLELVLVDFPRRKPQSAAVKKQNAGLAEKYGIQGYPTVIVLAPDGKLVGKTGYQPGGATKYVEQLKGMIAAYEKDHPKPAAAPAPAAAGAAPAPAAPAPAAAR